MNKVLSRDGTPIAFERSGEGPAIIYVSPAFSHRAFDPAMMQMAALLAPHFTVFTYDRRGRGASGDTPPYTVEREIEDLEALIVAAGGAACVYGHSSGAVLALHAAAHGLNIAKLALYEPPFIVDDSRPPLPGDYVTQLTALLLLGRRGDAVELFMTKAAGVPIEAVAQMRNDPTWAAFEAVAHTLPYDGAIMGDTQRGSPLPLRRWASVTVPTLVMDGGASPAYMQRAVQALVDVLPNVQRRTLPGQDHGAAPEALAPVLEAFFIG